MQTIYENNHIRLRKSITGLFISLFPNIGLSEIDNTGQTHLAITDLSILVKIFIVLLASIYIYKLRDDLPNKNKINFNFILIYLLYLSGFGLSILINTPFNLKAWFKFYELAVINLLSLISIYNITKYTSKKRAIQYFLYIIQKQYFILLLLLVIVGIINKNLVYTLSEDRGLRLGGSFMHPNSLGLASVCFLISSYCLLRYNKISNISLIFRFMLSLSIIYFSGSSSGILVASITLFFIVYDILNAPLKLFSVLGTIFMLLLAIINYNYHTFSSYMNNNATWADRIIIYKLALTGIKTNLFFGVGAFEGVRNYLSNSSDYFYDFVPPHTHNLFIELIFSRGFLLGLPMAFIIFYLYLKSIYAQFCIKDVLNNKYLYLLLTIIITHGLVESSFFGTYKPFCHNYFTVCLFLIFIKRHNKLLYKNFK